MYLDNSVLQEIHGILEKHDFKWKNTGRISNDWKQRIYENSKSGIQLSVMDRTNIAFRLEADITIIAGIERSESCPRGSTLDVSYSHFKNNKGYCYTADSVEVFGEFIDIYNNGSVDTRANGIGESPREFEELQSNFLLEVNESMSGDSEARSARLAASSSISVASTTTITVHSRNPDVVAHALTRANGICEQCFSPAPFIRRSNSTPYLEVHHKIPLADNGDDSIENVIALCPNCHREAHYGPL